MTLDFATLLRPLEGGSPCGPDLSFSAEFDTLRELRREDDPTLDQGAWVTELKRADWPGVLASCESLLSARTKDLRVAGWYTEAACRLRGYAGLADGLDLYTGLIREFWDGVHPLPDGSDQELRIGSISWMLALVQQAGRRVPVLRHAEATFSLADIEVARQRQQTASGDASAAQAAVDEITRAQRKTPLADLTRLLTDAQRVPEALARLQAETDARLGDDGPGFVAAREAVADVVRALDRLVREQGGGGVAAAPAPASAGPSPASSPAATGPVSGPTDRAQALAQLRMVAEFFRRTEPHSPVAYLAERAASWGEMPLHTWLRTVMKEQQTLAQLEDLLGVAPPSDGQ